jgi:hypothetical protein
MARGRLLQQAVEQLALLGVERAEDLVLGGRERGLGLRQPPRALVGQLDDVATAIVARASAQDQPIALEFVEQPDQVGSVGPQRGRERLLGGASVIA